MNMNTIRKPIVATLFCLACQVPAAGATVNKSSLSLAYAAPAPSVKVRFSDLDIERGNGANTLYQRLQRAAKQVCGSADGRNIAASQATKACYNEALGAAVEKVNNEQLSELHQG